MRILFVYFSEPPSRDQQSARFQSNYLYEESVQDWVPVLLHTHTHKSASIFLCFTSNFSLCNRQVLNATLSHLEHICLPAQSPLRKVSLKPERHPCYFHISGSDSAKPFDMCFCLTGLGRLSVYWSAGLNMMKCGSLLKCPPTLQPSAAASVSRCWNELVINYINRIILDFFFLQHFISV